MSHLDDLPSTLGKYKVLPYGVLHHHRYLRLSKLTLWASLFLALFLFYLLLSPPPPPSRRSLNDSSAKYGGSHWEKQVRKSARPRSRGGLTVLVTGAAGFVGTHVPGSYVKSNVAGFVNLLEVSKAASPQPAVVWASSSSVYGLNSKVPFSS